MLGRCGAFAGHDRRRLESWLLRSKLVGQLDLAGQFACADSGPAGKFWAILVRIFQQRVIVIS